MIAAKHRLFSAEPKASRFPRHAHTEEVACSAFRFGPPLDKSQMVGNSESIGKRGSEIASPTLTFKNPHNLRPSNPLKSEERAV